MLAMGNESIRDTRAGAEILAPRKHSCKRSPARLAALLLLLCATLSVSGCIGLTGATKPASSPSTPAAADISVSPTTVNFGSVAVGGSVSQSVTVSNPGGSTLTVTQASTSASGFSITGASFPMTIGAGKQSIFTIAFAPQSKGAVSGTVSVVSDASSAPSAVSISGTGVTSSTLLNSSSSSLSFGNVAAGATSSQSVTLTNAGNSNVTISSVSVSGAKFSATGISNGLILSPGQHAALNVTFSPSAAGSLTGSVTVASNASNSPSVISLSGTGVVSVAHSVSLAWTAVSSPVAGYNVYRSTVSGGPYTKLNSSTVGSAQYTDSTVQGGQTYFYAVTSVASASAESAKSSQVSAAVPTP
jgi:Abnormal spindle-like microcephaly-assoc'd, ASPM-SPD-2-Hydin/HYDIN/CFA65/VesB-like, Ig-like domain